MSLCSKEVCDNQEWNLDPGPWNLGQLEYVQFHSLFGGGSPEVCSFSHGFSNAMRPTIVQSGHICEGFLSLECILEEGLGSREGPGISIRRHSCPLAPRGLSH